jgi:glycolate oxidase iron-sulfur subunit
MKHAIDPGRWGPLGAAMAGAVETCVHCGFCLAACPTYAELQSEMDSPRGRILLMKETLEGRLPLADALPYLDRCLGCLACEPACPSGVPYRNLISPFRAVVAAPAPRRWDARVRRWLLAGTLPHPGRFRAALAGARLAKPLRALLPAALRPLLDLAPSRVPAAATPPAVTPARGGRRARVALLAGCAQRVLDPDITLAAVDVLARNGVEVHVPTRQGCCGALAWHTGDLPRARALARAALRDLGGEFDAVLTTAAGCGSALHEYALILRGEPEEAAAQAFSARARDFSAFLHGLGELQPIPPLSRRLRLAWHDPCHLAHGQGVREAPRALLRLVPGLELVELPDAHLCCGSAGTYNLDQPELAGRLGTRKAAAVRGVRPDLVGTANIGCQTQLAHHLGADAPPVRHLAQVLRDAYAGRLETS